MPALGWNTALEVGRPEAQLHLLDGWGDAEGSFRWTDGKTAGLCAQLPDRGAWQLQVMARPYLDPRPQGRGPKHQRLRLMAGQRLVGEVDFRERTPRLVTFQVPAGLPPAEWRLELPDATSPQRVDDGDDTRELGLAVAWIKAVRGESAAKP